MEKMSELIAELRDNCQKLQTELLDSRNNHQQKQEIIKPKPRDTSTVGVQVTLLTGKLYRMPFQIMNFNTCFSQTTLKRLMFRIE